jgi:hypothetical protein
MKVRHRTNGREYTLLGKVNITNGQVWEYDEVNQTYRVYTPDLFDLVPDVPTWRDVTGECEYLAEGPDHLQGLWHGRTIVCPPAYRARKVQASRALDDDDLRIGEEEVCWHFIIEKREP